MWAGPRGDACQLTDELLAAIAGVRPSRPSGKSQAWETIAAQHDQIQAWLKQDLTLTKVHTQLGRRVWWYRIGPCIGMPQRNWGSGSGRPRCGWPTVSPVLNFRSISVGSGLSPMPRTVGGGWCRG